MYAVKTTLRCPEANERARSIAKSCQTAISLDCFADAKAWKFRGTKTQVSEALVDNGFAIDVWGFTGHSDHVCGMVLHQLAEQRLIQ